MTTRTEPLQTFIIVTRTDRTVDLRLTDFDGNEICSEKFHIARTDDGFGKRVLYKHLEDGHSFLHVTLGDDRKERTNFHSSNTAPRVAIDISPDDIQVMKNP